MRAPGLVGLALVLVTPNPGMAEAKKARPDADKGLTPAVVEGAKFSGGEPSRAVTAKLQILLDRNRFSVGVIDGRPGENVDRALDAFRAANGIASRGPLDAETWQRLKAGAPGPVLTTYKLAASDARGPFTRSIPSGMEAQAKLPRLGYRDLREMLAERFHAGEAFLPELNKGARLAAGATLTVPAVRDAPRDLAKAVDRVEVDKAAKQVRAYAGDKLVATYPATIGSESRPAPTGDRTVEAIADKPEYTYNPSYRFEGVKSDKPFKIKPGPNNPVGAAWIDLSVDGYGIHGTPEPSKVGKTASHGCVRLTNWDARELLDLVRKGTLVRFIEPGAPAVAEAAPDAGNPAPGQ